MNQDPQCQGLVKDKKNRKIRPCQSKNLLDNGFCQAHQNQAATEIIENIKILEEELQVLQQKEIEAQANPQQITKIGAAREQLAETRQYLRQLKKLCSDREDCQILMNKAITATEAVQQDQNGLSSLPKLSLYDGSSSSPTTKLDQPLTQIKKLSQNTKGLSTEVNQNERARALIEQQLQEARQEIKSSRADLAAVTAKATRQETEFQKKVEDLTAKLQVIQQQRQETDSLQNTLTQQLQQCQSRFTQISGGMTDSLTQEKTATRKYKRLYEEVMGREVLLTKKLKQLRLAEEKVAAQIEELKKNYEARITQMQNEWAAKSKRGGVILSQREEALQRQVKEMETKLQESIKAMQATQKEGQALQNQSVRLSRPQHELAEELLQATGKLKVLNTQYTKLSRQQDALQEKYGRQRLDCERRLLDANKEGDAKLNKLNQELVRTRRDIAAKQQEIGQVHEAMNILRTTTEQQIGQLQQSLSGATQYINQIKAEKEFQERQFYEERQRLDQALRAQQEEQQFTMAQNQQQLEADYRHRFQELEDTFHNNQLAQEQKERILLNNQKRLAAAEANLQASRQALEARRADFEEKMVEYTRQKHELQTQTNRVAQLRQELELKSNTYQQQIGIQRQSLQAAREEYEAKIASLRQRLDQALKNRSVGLSNLEKCNAARESAMSQVERLTAQNLELERQFKELKTRHEMTNREYQSHLSRLQAEANAEKAQLAQCAAQLEHTAQVHDHVVLQMEEMQRIRRDTEKALQETQTAQQAAKQMLRDREMAKQQILRLEQALEQCSQQGSRLKNQVKNTNQELRNLKQWEGSLNSELDYFKSEYERELQNRDLAMERQKMRLADQENQLRAKINNLKFANDQLARRTNQAEEREEAAEQALVDNVSRNASSLQHLFDVFRQGEELDVVDESNLIQS